MHLLWAIFVAASVCGRTQVDASADHLSAAGAFIDAVNVQNQAAMEGFIRARFVERRRSAKALSESAKRFLALSEIGVPITVGKVLKDDATVVIVTLKSSRHEDWEMKMSFAEKAPHGISTVYVGPLGRYSAPPKHYTEWTSLTDLLDAIKADSKVPAISVAFADGRLIQSAVVGEREIGKPFRAEPTDRWLIGSITKSMTATMIARLVDKRILRWDMTISDALPGMPMRPDYSKVTLLELLQHRSGVQRDKYVTTDFVTQASGESKNFVAIRDHYTRFTLDREPVGKPGELMAYSNAGYTIAAHMAEVRAKEPYEKLMQELVFDPLGMASARMGVPGTPGNPGGPGQLNGHVFNDKGELQPHVLDEWKVDALQEPAGAGVSMTVDDLLRFARYHLAGLRGHVTLMSARNFHVLHQPADMTPGAYKYACGWVTDESTASRPFEGHNGSDGTFFAEMAIWPEKNFAAVAISNAANKQALSPPMHAILAVYQRYVK